MSRISTTSSFKLSSKLYASACLALMVPALSACGSGGASGPLQYSNLYTSSYAAPGKTVGDALAKQGDKIEGVGVGNLISFGDDTATVTANAPTKIIIERLSPDPAARGAQPVFKLTVGTTSVIFTEDDLRSDEGDEYFEKLGVTEDDQERTIADIYVQGGSLMDAGEKVVVAFEYGLRVKADGSLGTADDSDGFVKGYGLIGLETNPADMPKDASAFYYGGANINLTNKTETYGEGVDQIRYYGDTIVAANFGSGTILGEIALRDEEVNDYGNERTRTELDGSGKVAINGTIKSNGFEFDLTANKVAADRLVELGVKNAEAGGAGRFYGADAEGLGALIAGDSDDYIINGVLWGQTNPRND